jgi:hypothetical protein
MTYHITAAIGDRLRVCFGARNERRKSRCRTAWRDSITALELSLDGMNANFWTKNLSENREPTALAAGPVVVFG